MPAPVRSAGRSASSAGLSHSVTACSTHVCRGTPDPQSARTVRTTQTPGRRLRVLPRTARVVTSIALLCGALATLQLTVGCTDGSAGKSVGSAETSAVVGHNMAGPAQRVVISKQAVANQPMPWNLRTPESAVRSYLDWTSYAYRIAESSAATPTMSDRQEVRVDSYVQLNLEKSQILDQQLESITFGQPSVGTTSTLLPATEHWSYRYVSINEVGKTLRGPYTADYATTYTVVKNKKGDWAVDNVNVRAIGEVK